jgi:HEAT repeat protein
MLTASRAWRAAALAALVILPLAVLRPWTGAADADITLIHGNSRPEDAAASEVLHAPSTAQGLAAKLQWATTDGARRKTGYWIGYVIPYAGKNDGMMSDSAPLDFRSLDPKWKGARVADVLAGKSLRDPGVVPEKGVIVISLHDPARGTRPEDIDRIRIQSMKLAAAYGGQPLYWLGAIDDRESFDWARRIQTLTRDREVRETAVDAVAYHADDEAVRGYLSALVRSQEPNELRAGATEHLGRFDDPSTLALLEKIIREDRSSEVRESAIEAVGRMESQASVQLLMRLARDRSQSESVRSQAIEALSDKASEDAVVALETLAAGSSSTKPVVNDSKKKGAKPTVTVNGGDVVVYDDQGQPEVTLQGKGSGQTIHVNAGEGKSAEEDGEDEIQRQAVESLGNLPPDKALPKLLKIARTHPKRGVRRQAIETIGGLDTPAAFDALVSFAWDQKESELAWAAVEAMEDWDQAAPKLIEIARRHPNEEVRSKAVETLGSLEPRADALSALDDIVRSDPSEDLQCRAVEAIAQFPEAQSLPRLEKIARTHPRVSVRRRAIEGIGELDPDKAAPILESLISSGAKKGS